MSFTSSKPKKIIIFSQYFWPENFRINDFAKALVERGHEVTVFTGKPNYPEGKIFEGYSALGSSLEDYHGVRVVRVPLYPRGNSRGVNLALNYLSYVFFATLYLFKVLKKYDFIFVYQLSPVTVCIPAILLKWLKKIPLYMWVQDLWPESLEATGAVKSKKIVGYVGKLVDFIYSQCDTIFVQSKGFVEAIQDRGVERSKIKYLPNWAESIFTKEATPPSTADLPKLEGSFKVLFAGNIGEAQDLPSILSAAQILRENTNIKIYLLGDGRKREWVEEQIEKRNLNNTVQTLGRFPLETMPTFFSQADALLVSLKDEPIFNLTIPGKVQSYLASNKPILGSLGGEGARVIQESQAGLSCSPECPEKLAEILLKCSLLSDEERLQLGKNGLHYFNNNFERELVLNKFEKWLHTNEL